MNHISHPSSNSNSKIMGYTNELRYHSFSLEKNVEIKDT